jgi:hypothetical protein
LLTNVSRAVRCAASLQRIACMMDGHFITAPSPTAVQAACPSDAAAPCGAHALRLPLAALRRDPSAAEPGAVVTPTVAGAAAPRVNAGAGAPPLLRSALAHPKGAPAAVMLSSPAWTQPAPCRVVFNNTAVANLLRRKQLATTALAAAPHVAAPRPVTAPSPVQPAAAAPPAAASPSHSGSLEAEDALPWVPALPAGVGVPEFSRCAAPDTPDDAASLLRELHRCGWVGATRLRR